MKNIVYSLLAGLCMALGNPELPAVKPEPLAIGDPVPDVVLQPVAGSSSPALHLANYKGKAILLDFFATWCGGCVQALPELAALQKQLGGRVQVISVSYEPVEKLQAFLRKRPGFQNNGIIYIAADSVLHELFPHRLLPHTVWLDDQLNVKAITAGSEVTAKRLEQLVNGNLPALPRKQDLLDFDMDKPLFENGNGGSSKPLKMRSTMAGTIPGLGTMAFSREDATNKTRRICYINENALVLYRQVLPVDEANRVAFAGDTIPGWVFSGKETPLYSYELQVPVSTPDSLVKNWMLQDLNRFFSAKPAMEYRPTQCLAVQKKAGKNLLPADTVAIPMEELISRLNMPDEHDPLPPIVLAESSEVKMPVLTNDEAIMDKTAIRQAITRNGYALMPVERRLQLLVFH